MNLFRLFADLARVDPDTYDRFDSRRRVFRHVSTAGRALTRAALPSLLSGLFQKAYGQAALSGGVVAVLNLALSLEYLEYYFYQQAIEASFQARGSTFFGQLAAADQAAFRTIAADEKGHIAALRGLLGGAAIADPTATAFDYSAGSNQLTPFASAASFLALAQAFEDLGVRAYKGGLPTVLANKTVLTAALNIHSVEARHASHIRTLRRGGIGVAGLDGGGPTNSRPKSWVSLQENGGPLPALTAAIYGPGTTTASPAEDNLVQARLNVLTNAATPNLTLTATAASEAFDEPLDAVRVKAIARSFVAAGNPKELFL